jgi:hypothetical protein
MWENMPALRRKIVQCHLMQKNLKNDKRNVGKRERRVELRGKTKAMKDKK